MLVLGLDTSTDYLTLAVCEDAVVRVESTILAERRHAERIVPFIDAALKEARLTLKDLDLLAVTIGPGSFTGLRIGVSTLKGLAEGAHLPLIGVSTLDAMTHHVPPAGGLVCPLLDARMDEVYAAVFRYENGARECIRPALVGPVEEALEGLDAPLTVFGEGAQRYAARIAACSPHAAVLPPAFGHPRGSAVIREALAALAAGATTDAAQVKPVYLRQSQPEEARRRRAQEKATA